MLFLNKYLDLEVNKQFSIAGKLFPGPGAYDIKSTIPVKERGNSFGREKRGKGDSRNVSVSILME